MAGIAHQPVLTMTSLQMITLTSLIDDAKCYELIRHYRWPDGVRCTSCSSATVIRHGRDETQRHRQRYRCNTVSKVLFHKHLELSPYFRADGVLLEFKPATA